MTTITHPGFELPAIDGLTAGWVLDRFAHPQLGMTRTAVVLGRAKVAGMEPAALQLADRMASVVRVRSLPADVVVTAVPSASGMSEVFARRAAEVLGLPFVELLGGRSKIIGRLDGSARGRIRPRVRRVPAHVLVVDDVIRTGDTMRACAAMLRERGASDVWAVAAVSFGDVVDAVDGFDSVDELADVF